MTIENTESSVENLDAAAPVVAEPSQAAAADTSDEALAQKPEIAAAFARVFEGKVADDDDAEATGGEATATPAEPAADDDATGAEGSEPPAEPAAAPAPKKDDAANKAGAQEATATLAPALVQAAKRAGWNDKEIADFSAANPALAERTFTTLHGTYNDLSQRYAALSRSASQQQQPAAGQQQQPPQTPANYLDATYKNLDAFAQNNGQDVAEMFRHMYEAVVLPTRQLQAEYEAQTRAATATQVEGTFAGFAKDFSDLYGKTGTLTQTQFAARQQVAQLADQIAAGASLQGIKMPVNEALERAHSVFTADRVAEQARKALLGNVQRRAGAISSRPTARRGPTTVAEGAKRTDATAMSAANEWWASRGSNAG